jgi:1-aminocyclopropane-1-carboxylate deaminase/D-cysteine desulfhydrase-like pyridoxal-dependent ACC family enzyme
MSVFWPVPVWNSAGEIRFAMAADATGRPGARYDPVVTDPPRISLPNLPRVSLLDGPTPLQPLPGLTKALGGRAELWIKREDLGPITFSGNKLRNLEFLLGAALAEGADTVVTSGRRWSNHCRLTAAAGARLGLDVHLVVSGPPVERSPNLDLMRLHGATVHQTATDDRAERQATVDSVAAAEGARGRRVKVIPIGGSEAAGAWGHALAAVEVARQAAMLGFRPDVIALPTATGGTQAGLVVGSSIGTRQPPRIAGIVVARSAAELRPVVERLIRELATLAGLDAPLDRIELDESHLGEGYGMPTMDASKASVLLARSDGILVDPVYTAKGLAGLIGLVRSGILDGRHAIYWHGGGLPAIFEPEADPGNSG